MLASMQIEIPFFRVIGRHRGLGFSEFAQVLRRTAISRLRNYIVPAAERSGVDLLEFALPEIAEAVSGRKKFKTAAKIVGRVTLRKQMSIGSRKTSARRIIPTNCAKQTSRRVILTNISHRSRRVIFGTNILWQFLEIL